MPQKLEETLESSKHFDIFIRVLSFLNRTKPRISGLKHKPKTNPFDIKHFNHIETIFNRQRTRNLLCKSQLDDNIYIFRFFSFIFSFLSFKYIDMSMSNSILHNNLVNKYNSIYTRFSSVQNLLLRIQ